MSSPEKKSGTAIDRYVSPTTISNPDVLGGLARVGLSPAFPDRLKSLNDVLAQHRTQFAGMRITLAPATDEPVPMVEIKRGVSSLVTIDMDVDPIVPEMSTGTLEIAANMWGSGVGIAQWQRHQNIVELLHMLYPDKPFSMFVKCIDRSNNDSPERDFLVDDIYSLSEADLEPYIIGENAYFVIPQVADKSKAKQADPVLELHLAPGFGIAKRLWSVKKVSYKGTAVEIEDALTVLSEFFTYDPQEDPELMESPDFQQS